MKPNLEKLRNRITQNYDVIKTDILSIIDEDNDIFYMAKHIASIRDAYKFVMETDLLGENEAKFLLRYKNPLDIIGTEWERYLDKEMSGDLLMVVDDIIDRNHLEDEYTTIEEQVDSICEMITSVIEDNNTCPFKLFMNILNLLSDNCNLCENRGDWGIDIEP